MTDRRRHVVYLTRNSEYHCRLNECVAVRSRSDGRRAGWARTWVLTDPSRSSGTRPSASDVR